MNRDDNFECYQYVLTIRGDDFSRHLFRPTSPSNKYSSVPRPSESPTLPYTD